MTKEDIQKHIQDHYDENRIIKYAMSLSPEDYKSVMGEDSYTWAIGNIDSDAAAFLRTHVNLEGGEIKEINLEVSIKF